MSPPAPDRTPKAGTSLSIPLLGMLTVPLPETAVWYPILGLLAIGEIVELPVATAIVAGQLLVRGRREAPARDVGTALGR